MHDAMSPTGVAAILLLALMLDYMSVGPDSIRDRLAFLLALPAIRAGFDGSPLDMWTVGALVTWAEATKDAADGARIAQASTSAVCGVLVAILALYCVGVLLPTKASSRLGGFAQLSFGRRGPQLDVGAERARRQRLNWRLWMCAVLLGILADLPQGAIGIVIRGAIDGLTAGVAMIPQLLFGVV